MNKARWQDLVSRVCSMLLMFNTWDEIKETLYMDKINFALVGNLNVAKVYVQQ